MLHVTDNRVYTPLKRAPITSDNNYSIASGVYVALKKTPLIMMITAKWHIKHDYYCYTIFSVNINYQYSNYQLAPAINCLFTKDSPFYFKYFPVTMETTRNYAKN